MNNSVQRFLFRFTLIVGFGLSLAACSWSVAGGVAGAILTTLVSGALLLGVTTASTGCDSDSIDDGGAVDAAGTDPDEDIYVGPCLTAPSPDIVENDADIYIGPCLTAPLPDVIEDDADTHVGPCLSPPAPDIMAPEDMMEDMMEDMSVGPCLSPPAPDIMAPDDAMDDTAVGPCLSPPAPDIMAPEDTEEDTGVGPCLSLPAPDVQEPKDTSPPPEDIELQPCLSVPPPDVGMSFSPAPEQRPVSVADARAAVRARLVAAGTLPKDVAARLNGQAPEGDS